MYINIVRHVIMKEAIAKTSQYPSTMSSSITSLDINIISQIGLAISNPIINHLKK